MRLQGKDGVVAKFVAWNLSSTDQSYVVVSLDDGQLLEWRLNDCHVVEDRKTSEAVELAATDSQQPHGAEPAEITPYWVCEKCTTVNGLDKTKCLGCGKVRAA